MDMPRHLTDVDFADVITVNLKVTNANDITNDLKSAISFLDSVGGGVLNIPYRLSGYKLILCDIDFKSNIVVNGNNNNLYVQSSATTRFLFHLRNGIKNVSIKDLNIISTDDQTRTNGRENLGSNIYAFNISGSNIRLSNIYWESLEAGIWVNTPTMSKNIIADNLRSYKTKQPIFMTYIERSYFSNLDLDCLNSVGHDHQIYLNGAVKDVFFDNLNLINGFGPAISTKTDVVEVPLNENVFFSNVKIKDTCGMYLASINNVYLNNILITEPNNPPVPIFKDYGMRFSGNGLFASNISVKGFDYPLSFSACSNVNISVGSFTDATVRAIENVNGIDIELDTLTFTIKPTATQMYFTQYDYTNRVTFNNCKFIYEVQPTTFPISIRATNERTIFQSCQFINKGTVLSAVMYNLSASKVIAKDNYFKGFTAFKSASDTATTEYNNLDLNTWY
jgi:hypothetical protein